MSFIGLQYNLQETLMTANELLYCIALNYNGIFKPNPQDSTGRREKLSFQFGAFTTK